MSDIVKPWTAQRNNGDDECQHVWIWLAPGYEVCSRCKAIRKAGAVMAYLVSGCTFCSLAIQRSALLCAACSELWTCWLPFPPTTNNLFSHGVVKGRVRRFPTRKYKSWRLEAVTRIRAVWRTRPSWPVPVVVKLELVPPDSRGRDADNYCKPVLDALVEARVLADDSNRHVKAVMPYWAEAQKTSGVIVTIRPARIERPLPVQMEMFEVVA